MLSQSQFPEMKHSFHVHFADGDDFTKTFTTAVTVSAKSPRDAKLLATQMAMTPMPGKPEHMQFLGIKEV